MQHRLALRFFVVICLLLVLCTGVVWWGLLTFTPYVYKYTAADIQELTDSFSEYLEHPDPHELPYFVKEHAAAVSGASENEFLLHIFDEHGGELTIPDLQPAGGSIDDYSDIEHTDLFTPHPPAGQPVYLSFAAQNTDLPSQVIQALQKTLPILSTVILALSAVMAAVCAFWLAAPIHKLSLISEKLANLDFSTRIQWRRTDEVGALAGNLDRLSSSLKMTLAKLQRANQKLKSDMELEREIEQRRVAFMAAASHELKTPLTIIRGQLEGMLLGVGRYRDRDTYLAKSLEEADRLQRMIADLLLLVRIDSSVRLHREPVQLDDLVRKCAAAFEDLWQRNRLDLQLRLESLRVDADPALIRRALDNLLLNAALFADHGSTVTVNLAEQDSRTVLSVGNACSSAPDEELERLFDPLYRADSARSRTTGGSGLGLFIVRSIAVAHDAEVAASRTEEGLLVTISFPEIIS